MTDTPDVLAMVDQLIEYASGSMTDDGDVLVQDRDLHDLRRALEVVHELKAPDAESRALRAALSSCWRVAEGQGAARKMLPGERLQHVARIAKAAAPPSILRGDDQ